MECVYTLVNCQLRKQPKSASRLEQGNVLFS